MLKSSKEFEDNLWDIPLPLSPPRTPSFTVPTTKTSSANIGAPHRNQNISINIILYTDKKSADFAAYHHAAAFHQPTIHL